MTAVVRTAPSAGGRGRRLRRRCAWLIPSPVWLVGSLAWLSHIVVDRALGDGLRKPDGFVRGRAG